MIRLAAGLGALAACLIGAKVLVASIEQRGIDKCQAAQVAAAAEVIQENTRLSRIYRDKSQGIADDYRKKLEQAKVRNAAAESQLVRLRIAIDEASSGHIGTGEAPAGPGSDGELIATLGGLLKEGGGLAEEGRRRVAELAEKTTALQTQLRELCVTP